MVAVTRWRTNGGRGRERGKERERERTGGLPSGREREKGV